MSELRKAAKALLATADMHARTGGCPMPVGVWVRLEALRAALAADADRVSAWQPIETCPDSCRGEYPKYVLFWNGHHTGVGYCYPSEDGDNTTLYVDETDAIISPKPTHWMPLPAPPMLAAAEKEPQP